MKDKSMLHNLRLNVVTCSLTPLKVEKYWKNVISKILDKCDFTIFSLAQSDLFCSHAPRHFIFLWKPYFWESHLSDDHQLRRRPCSVKESISSWLDLWFPKGGKHKTSDFQKEGNTLPKKCVSCPNASKHFCWCYRSTGSFHWQRQDAETQEFRSRRRTWPSGRLRGCWGRRGRDPPGGFFNLKKNSGGFFYWKKNSGGFFY